MPLSQGQASPGRVRSPRYRSWRSGEETQEPNYLRRLCRRVVNQPMPEEGNAVQEPAKPEPTYRKGSRYSESYRHLYGMRQDVLNKTRQLQWSLDQIVLYVRDLLR